MAILAIALDTGAAAMWVAGAGVVCGAIAFGGQPWRTRATGRHRGVADGWRRLGRLAHVGVQRPVHRRRGGVVPGGRNAVGAGKNAGLVAAAGSALLIVAPPDTPSVTSVALPTILTIAAGCVQAALIAVWPPQRWRTQSDALAWAYRSLADPTPDASPRIATRPWTRPN